MRSSTPILAVAVVLASLVAYSAVPDPVQAAPMTRPAITQEECPKNVNQPGASCGRIEVLMDYASPNGQKIDIGFVKTTASKFEKRRGTLFVNPGGPGGSVYNLFTLQNSAQGSPETSPQWSTEVREEWDIVAVQPRGLEGSTKLDCGEVSAGPIDQVRRFGGLINDACNAKMPGYAATLTTENTARDWDMVRQALGEEKISIYGMSYGTFLGSVYATMYPEHTDKVVLDAGLNPDNDMSESIPAELVRSMTSLAGSPSTMTFTTWGRHHEPYTSPGRIGSSRKLVLARHFRHLRLRRKMYRKYLVLLGVPVLR